ncbi:MAG: hypothetical protein JWO17_2534 [Actinomycetia bacterium]|nr:hypothetical protein [Actinomycetes bacterium]
MRRAEPNENSRGANVAPVNGFVKVVPSWPLLKHLRRITPIPISREPVAALDRIAPRDVDNPDAFHFPKSVTGLPTRGWLGGKLHGVFGVAMLSA